jgi:3-hydroxyisobutyrate dehydrogenase-like beta-hydroxyacid dehydrogenase
MRIGFIGTGMMGTPIAACLIRSGHALSVHDRGPEATAELRAQGAVPADRGFAAARDREVVFTSLPGPGEFEAAMLEPQTGVIAGLRAANVLHVGPSGAGAPSAPGALASDHHKRARAAGWGQAGFPVVARVLEAMAGAELRPGRRPE